MIITLSTSVHAADTAKKAKKAYAKLLSSTEAFEGDSLAGAFAIDDINDDGIPELCVFEKDKSKSDKIVYSYCDGEVIKLLNGTKYVSFQGVPENELLVYVWLRKNMGKIEEMYLFDGEDLEKMIGREFNKTDSSRAYYDYRGGNGEEITAEKFEQIYGNLKMNQEPVDFFSDLYNNTEKNRKKVLGYKGAGNITESEEASSTEEPANTTDPAYDLSNYDYRTVIIPGSSGALVFQKKPDGEFMNDYQYETGDTIYVNLTYRDKGYALAYKNGVYGYVVASYIDWDSKSGDDGRFDLSNYGYRTVSTNGRGSLVFQSTPDGPFMYDYDYKDGDSIYVNLYWRQNGYAIAYSGGVYGYVDADYIIWNTGSDSRYDLSNYGYRTVTTGGKGSLVFQSSPNGSFMYDYEFWDGDTIYVNLDWRKDGYAIAYQNGVYGYVDKDYINWSGKSSTDRYSLSNYGYRTVKTKGGDDTLVFQTSPGGSFMYDYQYWNGDIIYVNLYWRQDGYAIAYRNGEYGYVDAKYINW